MERLEHVLEMPREDIDKRVRNQKEAQALAQVGENGRNMSRHVDEYETLCLHASLLHDRWKEMWSASEKMDSPTLLQLARNISTNNRQREQVLLQIDQEMTELEKLANLLETYAQANMSIAEELEQNSGTQSLLAKEKRFLGTCELELVKRVGCVVAGKTSGFDRFASWMADRRASRSSDRIGLAEPHAFMAKTTTRQVHSSDKDSNSPREKKGDKKDPHKGQRDRRASFEGRQATPDLLSAQAPSNLWGHKVCGPAEHSSPVKQAHVALRRTENATPLKSNLTIEEVEGLDAVDDSDEERGQFGEKPILRISQRKKARTENTPSSITNTSTVPLALDGVSTQAQGLHLQLSGGETLGANVSTQRRSEHGSDVAMSQEPFQMEITPTLPGSQGERKTSGYTTPACAADAAVGATARILHSASTKLTDKRSSQGLILDGGSTVKKLVQSQ
uniref:Uncharacterized protein n=2 Tax=Picocystis salinarum TaxID=88271 RepID=A0A7S3U8Y4_9CHLO|mmetsp:Transcript_611/g.4188  ORF Transcript_611/g.4188 Transcript_611/m.4188 type:complete len:449 (+) Transcript_611:255-1601(+)